MFNSSYLFRMAVSPVLRYRERLRVKQKELS